MEIEFKNGAVALTRGNAPADLREQIMALKPWRKGPWEICGEFIDSEWRANLKWDRVCKSLPDLNHKTIADVGCGNGYYMFRMLEHGPKEIIGFDPLPLYQRQFDFLLSLAPKDLPMSFVFGGLDEYATLERHFDVTFCMGVIYHRRDPLEALLQLKSGLKPGGTLILESMTIPGEGTEPLFPGERYAQMRNVHFVPTVNCLKRWLSETEFSEIELVSDVLTTSDEQRRTEFMTFHSLADFLDPNDQTKTIEGYPAPRRAILKASRA